MMKGLSAAAEEKGAANPIVPTPAAADTDQTSRPGPRRRWVVPAWLSYAATAVVGGLLLEAVQELRHGVPSPKVQIRISEPVRETPVPESPDGGVGDEVLASTEGLPRVGPFIRSLGRSMPKQPYPNQRRPPCERGEREIHGGCWVIVGAEEKPPCGEKMFDYEGRCYFASFNGQPQPTSEEPR